MDTTDFTNTMYGVSVMDPTSERKAAWAMGAFVRRKDIAPETQTEAVYKRSFLNAFYEYARNTSMHGLKYVGDLNLHYFERFFWALSFAMAVFGATYFINILFTKFRESPVIMSLAPTTTKLSTFPFPAVTICNMNNVRKSNAANILKLGKKIDKNLIDDFCDSDNQFDFSDPQPNDTASWDYIKKLMIEVSQPCHEMLVYCQWYSTKYDCNDIFNPALTDEGMCCTFNRVKREFIFKNPQDLSDLNVTYIHESIDWSPEKGYPPDAPITYLPWRPIGAGSHMGLTIVVDVEADQYYCSSEHSVGFKILLHNPIETPKVASFGSSIRAGSETYVQIIPTIMISEDSIEDINVEKRQCYFIHERGLLYYRSYTQKNCIRECEANFTYTYCGCVLYYMPKDRNTRICGRKDGWCASYAKRVMDISAGDPNYKDKDFQRLKPCVCLPACHEIGYSTALSSSPLTNRLEIKQEFIKRQSINYFKDNMAIIHFFFTETQFTGTLRTRLFGFTEFLSNTGGLLGLFLGFSFLSVVEIGYFVTLRLWCSLNQRITTSEEREETNKNINYKISFPYIE